MKTLKDIATTGEIEYLLKNERILKEHVNAEPKETREVIEGETEVEFFDGLTVTIYTAANEPVAVWE